VGPPCSGQQRTGTPALGKPRKRCPSDGGPRVRIHFPPAKSRANFGADVETARGALRPTPSPPTLPPAASMSTGCRPSSISICQTKHRQPWSFRVSRTGGSISGNPSLL
jgi:hypothetical protein